MTTRDEALDEAAQHLVDAVAARDALSPDDAARAAGARTPAEIARISALIRAQRQPATAQSA